MLVEAVRVRVKSMRLLAASTGHERAAKGYENVKHVLDVRGLSQALRTPLKRP